MPIENTHQNSKKNRKGSKKIIFDDEVVTKDSSTRLINELANEAIGEDKKLSKDIINTKNVPQPGKKCKTNKKNAYNINSSIETNHKTSKHTIKEELEDRTKKEESDASQLEKEIESEVLKMDNQEVQKEESIRAKKRRRHQELLQAKKIRSELNLQEKCLSYLSLWKHSRLQWKFEKLKQIWLQQNVFDDVKIPDEFFNVLVEYFNSAKGKVKSNILKEATTIVDSVSEIDSESIETNVKYLRARNIVQNLQE
ncbi:hypothetical protein Trydic_g2660 [Trypoxylus dichotomus]